GEADTPESPYIVAPPTCHVEESEGSGTSDDRTYGRSCSAAMPPGCSAGLAEVAAMSDLAFRKSEEDEEVDESLDFDSVSEDAEDEGPTSKDEDPAVGTRVLLVESDGLSLGEEEEAVLKGQQQVAPVVGTAVSASLGLGYRALRRQELALGEDHVYNTFEVAPPALTTPSPEWSYGSFPISSAPSIVPLPILSPMISLTIPSRTASPVATSIATIPVDEDQFIEVGYDDHKLVHDMLLQQTALQRELKEMRGCVTALELERDRRDR
nr:hypothetical protein [Tanacetum cinerariifolium]